jgi:predicted ArsR family transcriptional regulator
MAWIRTTVMCDPSPVPTDQLERAGRRRVLAAVATAREAITTRELADGVAMHRNGVRAHLLALRDAGLVESRRVVRGPGRPRDAWSATAAGRGALGDGGATADLARWLAEIIAAQPALLDDVEDAGRRLGGRLGAEGERDAGAALEQAFDVLGFAPRRDEGGDPDEVTLRLQHCPYREAAASAGEVVCCLHRGITAGVIARADPAARLASFEPHDPFAAGCVVRVTRPPT